MVSEKVYAGLHNVVDCRRISRFIQDLARSYILSPNVDEAYGQMAKDESREAEALNGLNPGSEMSVMKSLDVKSGSGQFLTPMRVLPACSPSLPVSRSRSIPTGAEEGSAVRPMRCSRGSALRSYSGAIPIGIARGPCAVDIVDKPVTSGENRALAPAAPGAGYTGQHTQ